MKTPVTISGNTEIDTSEVDRLFRLKSGGDMLEHKIFKNARDAAIGLGAFRLIRRAMRELGVTLNRPNTLAIVAGDGNYPRTSGTFAFRTAGWEIVAVAPSYKENDAHARLGSGPSKHSHLIVFKKLPEN